MENLEIELKFYPINPGEIRQKLLNAGGKLIKENTLMKRVIFDPTGGLQTDLIKIVRVRDEGGKITLNVKNVVNETVHGIQEIELTVNDYETACQFLKMVGMKAVSYQESYREEWSLNLAHVTIDTWPALKPFLEIEAENIDEVRHACLFSSKVIRFGSC